MPLWIHTKNLYSRLLIRCSSISIWLSRVRRMNLRPIWPSRICVSILQDWWRCMMRAPCAKTIRADCAIRWHLTARFREPILSRTTSVRLTVRELFVTEMFIRTMSDAIRENWSAKVQQTGFSSGQMKVRIKYWIWELIPTVCELPKKWTISRPWWS